MFHAFLAQKADASKGHAISAQDIPWFILYWRKKITCALKPRNDGHGWWLNAVPYQHFFYNWAVAAPWCWGDKASGAAKDKQTVFLCQDIVPILYLRQPDCVGHFVPRPVRSHIVGSPPRALWRSPWAWGWGQCSPGLVWAEEGFALREKVHPVATQGT